MKILTEIDGKPLEELNYKDDLTSNKTSYELIKQYKDYTCNLHNKCNLVIYHLIYCLVSVSPSKGIVLWQWQRPIVVSLMHFISRSAFPQRPTSNDNGDCPSGGGRGGH